MTQHLRVGVVGAGRVGAVLAARLRAAGHEIVAVAGESDASTQRIAALLPGVPTEKPSVVARASDVLLLTVPDDMLPNVVSVLSASGAIREGQYVVHTSGRHGLAVLAPAAVFGLTAGPGERELVESLVADLGGRAMWVPEESRTLYHAALAHGANHLVTLVTEAMELLTAAGAEDPAATLRPLLSAALDNALAQGDAALTGPIVRGDANTVAAHLEEIAREAPQTMASYVALGRATLGRAVTDGRLVPIRALKINQLLDEALAESAAQPVYLRDAR